MEEGHDLFERTTIDRPTVTMYKVTDLFAVKQFSDLVIGIHIHVLSPFLQPAESPVRLVPECSLLTAKSDHITFVYCGTCCEILPVPPLSVGRVAHRRIVHAQVVADLADNHEPRITAFAFQRRASSEDLVDQMLGRIRSQAAVIGSSSR
jgi:hypothetical protein